MFIRKLLVPAFVLALGCLCASSVQSASAGEKKKEAGTDEVFKKAETLTDTDARDTKMTNSYSKTYKVKLTEGKAYRIDLSSKDFDTFLRVEDAAGKEVAFNDDIAPNDLNSRLIYATPKTGEYKIIVTTFEPNKTGDFLLEMNAATAAEAKDAIFQARIANFAESPRAEQNKLIAEVTKGFQDKGENLTVKDLQLAATIFLLADDSDAKYLREIGESFAKIFSGASNKQVASLTPFLENSMKALDKIGTKIEISGKRTDGKDFDLAKLKGKVVLVDFWGTWCPPCVAEIPNIHAAYKKYHAKGFEVIGVSSDKDDDVVVDFLQTRKLPWGCINVEDSRTLIKTYAIKSYPSPVLVGADGRIVSLRARGPQLERLLERLLKDKK